MVFGEKIHAHRERFDGGIFSHVAYQSTTELFTGKESKQSFPIEVEAKILDVSRGSVADKLEGLEKKEPIVEKIENIWFDTSEFEKPDMSVSARVRRSVYEDGTEKFSWNVKIRNPQKGDKFEEPPEEKEGTANTLEEVKRALTILLKNEFELEQLPELDEEMKIEKTRTKIELSGEFENVVLDFDVLESVSVPNEDGEMEKKIIDPPIAILEIEKMEYVSTEENSEGRVVPVQGEKERALEEARIQIKKCAERLGLSLDLEDAGKSTRGVLRDRGYL